MVAEDWVEVDGLFLMFIAIDGFVDRGGVDGACSGSSTAVELPVILLVTLLFRVVVGAYSLLMMFIIACSYLCHHQ